MVWIDSRPVLVADGLPCLNARASQISLEFKSDANGPLWRYVLVQDDGDVWLSAVWAHAAADGPSMLRFVEAIGGILSHRPVTHFKSRARERTRPNALTGWLLKFVIEHRRNYLQPAEIGSFGPGVAWFTVAGECGERALQVARDECGSVAAWLGGLACAAVCEQRAVRAGLVLLNLPILRDDSETVGGFGFGVGSLIMPINIDTQAAFSPMARSIAERLKTMTDQGWDENFERFLESGIPSGIYYFLRYRGRRGRSAPIINCVVEGR